MYSYICLCLMLLPTRLGIVIAEEPEVIIFPDPKNRGV